MLIVCRTHGFIYFVDYKWVQQGEEWLAVKREGVKIPPCVRCVSERKRAEREAKAAASEKAAEEAASTNLG